MIQPPLSELLEKVNNRYSLVIGTAKRARQLADGDLPLVNCRSDKAVTIALNEIREGKITLVENTEAYDIYDELLEDK